MNLERKERNEGKFLEVNEEVKIGTATSIAWRQAIAWCTVALFSVFIYEGVHTIILKHQTAKALRDLDVKEETRKTNHEFGNLILKLRKEKRKREIAEHELNFWKKESRKNNLRR